jgi:hypothetical protein
MDRGEGINSGEASRDQAGRVTSLQMMGDSSTAESQLLNKFDDIQRWEKLASLGNEPLEERKIQTLFQASTGYCSLLLPALVENPGCTEEETIALRRNIRLLRQWGEAYSVADGTLDHLAAETSDVSDTIVLFLVEIASILCQSKF